MNNNNSFDLFRVLTGIIAVTFTAFVILLPYILIVGVLALAMPFTAKAFLIMILVAWILITKPFTTIRKCHRNAMRRMEENHNL